MIRGALCISGLALAGALIAGPVLAVPALQLYIEGATYNAGSETWVTESNTFRVWAVGNFDDATESITNVRLATAFFTAENTGGASVALTGTQIGGTGSFGTFTQSGGTAANPTLNYLSGDGDQPVLGSGNKSLSEHGIYQPGVSFFEWSLGNFETHNSPLANFADAFPTASASGTAQIKAYDISVTGFASGIHIDLYDTISANNGASFKTVFAPFSHDAESGVVPEPGSLVLLGSSILAMAASGFRFRRRRRSH